MKLLGLLFSPRKNGNTELLLDKVFSGAKLLKAETELYRVADKDIKPCDGCGSCFKTGECHIQDDMQQLYDSMLEAAEDLGKQMAQLAEKKFKYPEEFKATHIAYGTHTW